MAKNNRKSQMVSMNAGYSLPDAMREDVGYKACWVCPDEESAIAFMKNMKAVAAKQKKKTKCYRYRIPKFYETFDSLGMYLQLASNGQMKAEEFPSEWLVVMEIVDNEN
jgi:hypothetical protein